MPWSSRPCPSVEGFRRAADTDTEAKSDLVSAGYFETLGVPLRSGREFAERDGLGAPKVAIVNEAFAKKFNLGRDAVARRMGDNQGSSKLDIEIVGLVKDAKYSEVKDAVPPQFFPQLCSHPKTDEAVAQFMKDCRQWQPAELLCLNDQSSDRARRP